LDIILIPGLWLDGASWDAVVPVLEAAGHRAHPITLPGMESLAADRSAITLRGHVDAVVEAIDAADAGPGGVVLVGHSAGGAVAHAAADARPDRVAHVIYVGGFPTGDGSAPAAGFAAEHGEVLLPDWTEFDEADVADLDDAARARFRERAIPSPEHVTTDAQRLVDDRRYDVPVTVVCPEFTSEMLRDWVAKDFEPVRELTKIREVDYVDLPAGHWPQLTRPEDLAQVIVAIADRAESTLTTPSDVDEPGRTKPPAS
jgi:pimeloyl-ACP methyl ester carboxylesterase